MNTTDKGMHHPAASLLSEQDLYLYNEGSHFRIYDKLGAHLLDHEGQKGVYFAVWAPNAQKVTVVGDYNQWNKTKNPLHQRG
ncbi:MAG: 1,4-alpha-glucan branching enzyme, partial [Elusimicrobia bacterium]|nr:1,4-alpha-glucan branching enzyme [Elusimicrobiota bacterium]